MRPQTMQLNEKIDHILAADTVKDMAARAQEISVGDPSFVDFIRMAVQKDYKICGLPEGLPDTYKPETDIPDGIAQTTARQELRRIRNFVGAVSSMQSVPRHRRELSWLQMLEGMHWKESQVLTLIKDQTLLNEYPTLSQVLAELRFPVDVEVASAPKKKSEKKKAPESK